MAVSAATAALLSRGGSGSGIFALTSALALRRKTASNASSPFFSASATNFSPLLACRHTVSAALLFPSSPSPPQPSRRCCQLSCLAPHAPSQESAAAPVADEDAAAAPPLADPASVPSDPVREAAALLDIRVGRVLRAWRHPEADSLYVEEVDVGEAEPRTICSGLVAYVPLEALEGARVVVLANLKPRNMRGVKSNGMLLAASDAVHETVELLAAPEGAVPGERVWFSAEGHKEEQPEPATPNQVQKKKVWEFVQPHLKTDENFVAMLGEHPMQTSAGIRTEGGMLGAAVETLPLAAAGKF
ncbi:hypothetical protein Taro_036390, partial [Colocasia esculenta]|nr:hypothetical protein [Colocasia esculenta]